VLTQHYQNLANQKSVVWHIPSQYTAGMAAKSTVVSNLVHYVLFTALCMQITLGVFVLQ